MSRHVAGELLLERMTKAFRENPRGELYRGLGRETLWNMLKQNIAEVELATAHGDNDILDKLADCGNYLAFLYRNLVDPLEGQPASFHLLDGITTKEAMALTEHLLDKFALRTIDTSGFGQQAGAKYKVVPR